MRVYVIYLDMAQLNVYVPDEVARTLRDRAAKAGMPLSRFVVSLLAPNPSDAWPAGYFGRTCGFLQEKIAVPADPVPEPVEGLD